MVATALSKVSFKFLLVMIIDEKLVLDVLMRHSSEIMQWMNEENLLVSNDVKPEGDPVELLPIGLQTKLRNKRAFRRAFANNLLSIANGRIVSHFRSQRELTYFCCRCFAGDTTVGRVLLSGDYNFPARELETLFMVKNMRDSRKKIRKCKVPKRYKIIDTLFDTLP